MYKNLHHEWFAVPVIWIHDECWSLGYILLGLLCSLLQQQAVMLHIFCYMEELSLFPKFSGVYKQTFICLEFGDSENVSSMFPRVSCV
jgi:hypothetical protein